MHHRKIAEHRIDSKRKASEQLDDKSNAKRIKNAYSESITPEKDEKVVVPFPEKACIKCLTIVLLCRCG